MILNNLPIEDGFHMPAEFSEHEGTVMIYPTRPGSWGKDRAQALSAFGEIFREILKRENLYLLVGGEYFREASAFTDELIRSTSDCVIDRQTLRDRLKILEIESDDAWARDVGPTFVTDGKGHVRGINWSFNAWGGEVDGLYRNWDRDNLVASKLCENINIDYYDASDFVLEGGSIHSDGEGTVLVTASCLLSGGRNPDMTKGQIEDKLCSYLGAKKILWLPRGIYNDETNEHVDNVCAFIKPGEVVLAWTDKRDDPQYEMSKADLDYLESETDAMGRKLVVHKMPIPDHPVLVTKEDLSNYEFEEGEDVRDEGERLAASYVNFYFINGEVLVPMFGGENSDSDQKALKLFKALCPDREVVGISARAILLGGGNIHCITQQLPGITK